MVFLFCLVAWNHTSYFTRLHRPVYQYDWFKPGNDKSGFLFSANFYLVFYIVFSIIYALQMHHRSVLLFIGVLAPLFTVHALFIMFRQQVLLKKSLLPAKQIPLAALGSLKQGYNVVMLLILFLVNFIYFQVETDPSLVVKLLIYELVSLAALLFMTYVFPRQGSIALTGDIMKGYYYRFWFYCVVAVSLLPVHCYFQFAQEKEMMLVTKTNQLHLAQKTEERLSKFGWFDRIVDKRNFSVDQKKSILFSQGIYAIDDKTELIKDGIGASEPMRPSSRMSPELYDDVVRHVSWDYRSLDKTIPFNSAHDSEWGRFDFGYTHPYQMSLFYDLRSEVNKPCITTEGKTLRFSSCLPGIATYYRIGNFRGLLVIGLFSVLLLLGFYHLLKSAATRLFVMPGVKRSNWSQANQDNFIYKVLMNSGHSTKEKIEVVLRRNNVKNGNNIAALGKAWNNEYLYERMDKEKMKELEDRILFNQYHLSSFYEEIWNSCSDREKYFLYDLATDSFVNYKNTALLEQLLHKGILVDDFGDEVRIMSVSFRNYILEKEAEGKIAGLKQEFEIEGTWGKIRTPVLLGITVIGTFIFVTQQDLVQRVVALVPTLSALSGLGAFIVGSKTQPVHSK